MNEFDFIRRLSDQTSSRKHSARVLAGIGDDAAVLGGLADRNTVITTDLLVEGIDFYRDATPPRLLGHKALAISLSDIAAMGARPLWSLLTIGLPADIWATNFKEEFYEGYFVLADKYGVTLVGGDLSEVKGEIVIDSIVMGEVAAGSATWRSSASPGDQIFVTGTLGGAAAGLKLIEMGARLGPDGLSSLPAPSKRGAGTEPGAVATGSLAETQTSELKAIEALLHRQLQPQPRVGWGLVLSQERLATAMIDISDGLSSDLAHLCEASNAGALIQSALIPIDHDVITMCGRRALDPLMLALNGGEDFELLFTVHPDNVGRLPKRVDGVELSHIGEVTCEPFAVRIAEKDRVWDLQPQGFSHFKE
jgi:thiamine-monophosphate kinase